MSALYLSVSVKLRVAARWKTTETFDSSRCRSASLIPRLSSVMAPATGMICLENCGRTAPSLPNTCNITHDPLSTANSLPIWMLSSVQSKYCQFYNIYCEIWNNDIQNYIILTATFVYICDNSFYFFYCFTVYFCLPLYLGVCFMLPEFNEQMNE